MQDLIGWVCLCNSTQELYKIIAIEKGPGTDTKYAWLFSRPFLSNLNMRALGIRIRITNDNQ